FGRSPAPHVQAQAAATAAAGNETRVKSLRIKTEDGAAEAYLVRPERAGSFPGVLLYTDIMGVRPVFLDMARRLAAAGFNVLLPNLFYRNGPPSDPPLSVHHSAEFGRLLALAQTLSRQLIERDAQAYAAALRADEATRPGSLGCVGYCMSGAFAIWTAAALPQAFGAVACFHGGHLSTGAPDSPDLLAARTRAAFYFGFAETDAFMKPAAIEQLRARLTEAGRPFVAEVYPGTYHGFTIPDASYDREASERHFRQLVSFLTRTLAAA
ncbi:MAG TPA: dienelactone hydrolase family protein, partial [Steroidobacteraceae bacterium]|nr:dienelactone hydrolase family protein [Steroidobacteraceae bacterium]